MGNITKGRFDFLRNRNKTKSFLIKNSQYIVFLAIVIISTILSKGVFINFSNIKNLLIQNTIIIIIAFGQFLVILTGGIDLSVGAITALSAMTCAKFLTSGHGVLSSAIISLATGAGCGFINGILVAKVKIPPFITTLGMMGIAYSLARQLSGGSPIYGIPENFFIFGGNEYLGPIHIGVAICFSVFLFVVMFSEYFYYGRYIYAVGGNERASWLTGLNIDKVKLTVYMLSGIFCGIAAIIYIGRTEFASPDFGANYNLESIAAVVIGGGSLFGGEGRAIGVVIGALTLGILSNLMNILNVNIFMQSIIKGAILLGAVYINLINSRLKK